MSNAQTRSKKAGVLASKKLASAKTSHGMKEVKPVKFNANQTKVITMLVQAGDFAKDLKSVLLAAAKLAKADLPKDEKLSVKEKVAAVTKLYAVQLTGLDDNAKGIFRSALTLYCIPDYEVVMTPAKGNTPEVLMKASEALDKGISKHALTSAASAIREDVGQSNKKPAAKVSKKPDVLSVGLLAQLPAIVNDKKAFDELKAALIKMGFKITPITAAKKVAAQTETKKPVFAAMVEQITNAIPAAH